MSTTTHSLDCLLCDEGPKGRAICNARRGNTALRLAGRVMRDDQGRARCLACSAVVPDGRVYRSHSTWAAGPDGTVRETVYERIMLTPIITGREAICCGTEV